MRHISIRCESVEYSTDPVEYATDYDSWFKRRILHVPNWIEIMFNNLCLLEWEFKTRHSRSAILFGKTMRRLNQISRTYSFESTKISIWFGACKMRRLNQA